MTFFTGKLFAIKTVLTLLLISIIRNDSLLNGRAKMISAKNPILLNIKRTQVNGTGIIARMLPKEEDGRSKPLFFEQTLGIRGGQPFTFDIEKWQALQACGLFKNLFANVVTNDNGEVVLLIDGEELLSTTFTPEVGVTASIERPEVEGGVSGIVFITILTMIMVDITVLYCYRYYCYGSINIIIICNSSVIIIVMIIAVTVT
jgi:hypothetical protein